MAVTVEQLDTQIHSAVQEQPMDENEREIIKELMHYNTGYEVKLLRVLLTIAVGAVLLLDVILILLYRAEWSWLVIPAGIADGFIWMLAIDFFQDARSAREYELEKHRLSMEMRHTLNELSAARLRQALRVDGNSGVNRKQEVIEENDKASNEDTEAFQEEPSIKPSSTSNRSYGRIVINQEALELDMENQEAVDKEKCLEGISRDYPDPVGQWGLVRVREVYGQMVRDFMKGENSTYGFIYGVVSGKAVSQTEWYARGMSKRTHSALMELLEKAGVVSITGQGKPRKVLIKNPVQAWLVASETYNRELQEEN